LSLWLKAMGVDEEIKEIMNIENEESEASEGLAEYVEVKYLTPENASFYRTPGGVLTLEIGTNKYPRVNLHRAFPFTLGDKYISVRDAKGKEVGIVKDIVDFPPETAGLLKEELERRYFTPRISRITSVKSEFGYSYWEVETDRGPRRFNIKGLSDSIIPLSDVRLLIMDIDGNRFEIEDVRKLDRRSQKHIEGMI
jgi:hypothetical protein